MPRMTVLYTTSIACKFKTLRALCRHTRSILIPSKLSNHFLPVVCDRGFGGDASTCKKCEIGSYKPEKENTNCTSCVLGLTTLQTGAIYPEQCSKNETSSNLFLEGH